LRLASTVEHFRLRAIVETHDQENSITDLIW